MRDDTDTSEPTLCRDDIPVGGETLRGDSLTTDE
jgi:hypothetical protein